MVEATNDFIVEPPRRTRTGLFGLAPDLRRIRDHVGRIDIQAASFETRMADLSNRMDRHDEQIERVMRRLELSEASH